MAGQAKGGIVGRTDFTLRCSILLSYGGQAIPFEWGNVWEWTSSAIGHQYAIKGGAWDSRRTDCRTESRGVGRNPGKGYANVGFRGIRESK